MNIATQQHGGTIAVDGRVGAFMAIGAFDPLARRPCASSRQLQRQVAAEARDALARRVAKLTSDVMSLGRGRRPALTCSKSTRVARADRAEPHARRADHGAVYRSVCRD